MHVDFASSPRPACLGPLRLFQNRLGVFRLIYWMIVFGATACVTGGEKVNSAPNSTANSSKRGLHETAPLRTELQLPVVDVSTKYGVPVWINGQGPFAMGFDTGQSVSLILSKSLAKEFELERLGTLQVGDGSGANSQAVEIVRLNEVRLPGTYFEAPLAVIMDLPHSGSLGLSLFADCSVGLHPHRSVLRLSRRPLPEPDGRQVLPLIMSRGVTPEVTISINQDTYVAIVDSGWDGFVELPADLAAELPLFSSPEPVARARTLFNDFEITQAQLNGVLQIGDFRIENPILRFQELLPDIILGAEFLAYFDVTVDVKNRRIRFLPLTDVFGGRYFPAN